MSITVVEQGKAVEDENLTVRPAKNVTSGQNQCGCKCYCAGPTDIVASQTDSAQIALQG
jgi:hypothetical protein